MPERVRIPLPVLVNATVLLPFSIIPEKAVEVVSPTVKVIPPATVLVTVPEPESEPTVCERPAILKVPEVMLRAPDMVISRPLQLNTLLDVTSPMVKVVVVIVVADVTPAALLIFKIPNELAPPYRYTVCAAEPFRFITLVAGGAVKPPPTPAPPLLTFPPILIVPAPVISI